MESHQRDKERESGNLRDTSRGAPSVRGHLGVYIHVELLKREAVRCIVVFWSDTRVVSTPGGVGRAVIVGDRGGSVGRCGRAARSLLVAGDVKRVRIVLSGRRLGRRRKKRAYKGVTMKCRNASWAGGWLDVGRAWGFGCVFGVQSVLTVREDRGGERVRMRGMKGHEGRG